MAISSVCPTEDAVQAFLEHLVDPLLPSKYAVRETPSLATQELVAKQVHAVVLLYNYFLRKRHPDLRYLDFENFCKWALVLKPNLKSHMKLMVRTDDTELSEVESQFSLLEKAIQDACVISRSLDALSAKGLPVSKVSILLTDLSKENCILLDGSITRGVHSLIEKDVNESCYSPDCSIESKYMSKRKKVPNKRARDELDANECCFQQIAFSAVKEATKNVISQSDLNIIESHLVRSLSKDKTATRFYIMQCVRAAKARWIPIKDVFDSLRGPLLQKVSSRWMHSPVVEYFHLLPYAPIISQWFSRDVFPISFEEQEYVQEVVNVNGFEMTEEPSEPEVQNNRNKNLFDGGRVEASRNSSDAESEKQNKKNDHFTNDFMDAINGPWNMDMDNPSVVHNEKMSTSKNVAERVQHDSLLKKITSRAEHDLNGTTDVAKFEVANSAVRNLNQHKNQNVITRKAASNNTPGQAGILMGNHASVICESNSKCSAKLHNAIASKDHVLSKTALRVLLNKRDKLVLQLRKIGDEIAQCDKKMQTILNGGEDDLELKLDLVIEGCNDACPESTGEERTSKDYEDPCWAQCKKRSRSSEEASSKQNPCQELDGICKEKNWVLPTYQVFPSDGGYQAKVTVKGTNFESLSLGDACPKPHEARSSAATTMLAKLLDHV
ncbi:hypothetical protein E1A91_D09G232600v1 [Gossypium mustelinum]|uniref:DRBM domain-containing protein n=3 Tax=Gossypium TaxID=3633 RepID=A0A5D2TMU0_GOSMU|nr:hypothetical protein ES332_D09G240800v1 [Gossypium tomentosum]TYH55522.1 hypothetical protein ES332_D09G240800v1 [Gossypium tomentosum]TYI66561.1 hypothetical protein E1A91_D09G232600v1 [Gossypium mustelinum]